MRPNQGKSILVVLNGLQRNLPSLYRVAIGAVGAELAAMNIGMAVSALGTYIFEDQARVTLAAANLLVHPAQRISGEIMIKLWIRPDRLPTRVGVAIGTRKRKRPMRIGYLGLGYACARSNPCIAAGIARGLRSRIAGGVAGGITGGVDRSVHARLNTACGG